MPFARSAFAVLAVIAAPAGAQVGGSFYTTPGSFGDQVHYVTPTGMADHILSSAASASPQSAFRQLATFGDCVASRDPAGSAAYVRASVSGDEQRAYHALRVARACETASHAGRRWLAMSDIRRSAIADAVRVRQPR